ncbi:hypothetical protein [Symbiopectobacterium purcellii]|uniref:hypothetical protein n=1 Tax=Symbiopectobacterium purcellii TaxID=2871826 RepID=UPI003F8403BE
MSLGYMKSASDFSKSSPRPPQPQAPFINSEPAVASNGSVCLTPVTFSLIFCSKYDSVPAVIMLATRSLADQMRATLPSALLNNLTV